jgi:hypothetical protein
VLISGLRSTEIDRAIEVRDHDEARQHEQRHDDPQRIGLARVPARLGDHRERDHDQNDGNELHRCRSAQQNKLRHCPHETEHEQPDNGSSST